MRDVLLAAAQLQELLVREGLPFCFIGGVAVQRWGEVRVTKDADAAVLADLGQEQRVLDILRRRFAFRVQQPLEMVVVHRVILLQEPESGVGLDLSLAASGFEQAAIARGSIYDFGENVRLRTCSAEDLVLYKAVADRQIDWHDIRGILVRQQEQLDRSLIDDVLPALAELKEDMSIVAKWEALRDRYR